MKLDKEKQEIINKFDEFIFETIKEMFPDEQELFEKVKGLKEKKNNLKKMSI